MTDLRHYDVIVSPAITEKSTLASDNDQVIFNVARTASKPEIKAAVEALLGVKVKAVNTLVRKGKVKRFRGIVGKQTRQEKLVVSDVDDADAAVGRREGGLQAALVLQQGVGVKGLGRSMRSFGVKV